MKKIICLLFLILLIITSGCGTTPTDPEYHSGYTLQTNALTLYKSDTGIYPDTSVLDDSNNHYLHYFITGDWNNFKWDIQDLPIIYAKEKFYMWATYLTIESFGEPQYYVGKALSDLCTINYGTPEITNQAIRAYQKVLDVFFNDNTYTPSGTPEKLNVKCFEEIQNLGGTPEGCQLIIVDYTNKYVVKDE